jgi:hypothetical protein
MAKLYGEIAKSALLTLDKSFSRALGQPLDASEVYYSLEAAKTYAATPAAYVGQKIVVIEDGKVTHYSVDDTAGTLKEVGVRPTGDGKSITVSAEGVVSILGVANADSLTLPRMKEDKSGIEWVPVSQVVEGDGNDNTTYTFTELTKGEGEAAEVYGFVVKTFFNGTEVEGGSIEIVFDVYTKSEADAKFLAKADYTPYDDTALANRVKAVEDNKADKSTTYTKTEVDTAIDNAKKSILGEDVAEAYDTLKEIQEILEGTDGETIDGLVETVADNKAKIEILNGGVNVVGSVDKKIADAVAPLATTEALNGVKATAEAAQTAEQVGAAIEAALEDYYTAEEVDNKGYAVAANVERDYAKKATTLAGYGITDAYTKNEVDAKIGTPGVPEITDENGEVTQEGVAGTGIFANAYSKAEINKLLDEVQGGSSASADSVLRQLNEYKTSNNQRVFDLETAVGKEVNGDEPATGLFAEIDAVSVRAEKGITDAAAADAKAVANAEAITLANNAHNALANIVNGADNTESHAAKLAALAAKDLLLDEQIAALQGIDSALQETVAGHGNKITALESKDNELAGLIAGKVAQGDFDALAAKVDTGSQKISEYVAAQITANAYNDTAIKALITAEETRAKAEEERLAGLISAETSRADTEEKRIVGLVEAEAARADAAEKANKALIDGLDAAIKAVLDNEGGALDSIKELATWVEEHESEVLPVIEKNTTDIAALTTRVAANEKAVSETLPTAIATALESAKAYTDEKAVTADGTTIESTDNVFSVKAVSTDVLVQGNLELVLNGGSASTGVQA